VPILERLRADLLDILAVHRDSLRRQYNLIDLHTVGFIHVRRGDYLTAPPGIHWIQDESYYRPAMEHVHVRRWLVLSDDPSWCKDQAMFHDCEIIHEPDELVGLALMSLCHGGAILGNSTYSWWGAMLGAEPSGAPIVYPSKWCENKIVTLFPERWICI